MWDNSNELMFDIFDLADNGETKFPIECPMCKKLEAHFFMHRFDARRGGAWAWCGGCHNFAHMSGVLPDWWENLQGIDGSLLSCDLDYLNGQASKIDAYVNSLPRTSPHSK